MRKTIDSTPTDSRPRRASKAPATAPRPVLTRTDLRPGAVGLYDPAFEHDACGVGFVAHIKGQRSHELLEKAYRMLCQMDHRGARGSEPDTGDGAGILTALPAELLRRVARDDLGKNLAADARIGAGVVFLPQIDAEREHCKRTVEALLGEHALELVGWRHLPTEPDEASLGPTARAAMPVFEQLIVTDGKPDSGDAADFERRLYLARKRASHQLRTSSLEQAQTFYVCSLSSHTIIYKGMLTCQQLFEFFPDLRSRDFKSHLAMVHSRFATNTFPSWDRAQPNRTMSHNGEINTLRGNANWMHAREGLLESELFGDDLDKLFPIVEPDCSDSGSFDNVLEFLLMGGRSLREAVMMMVPEAWQGDDKMPQAKRDFYEYHSSLMEPWDGPASITFTDGHRIGAVLDRNGLRPSRYYVTEDDLVIMASEVGVLPVPPERVLSKGRLQPGRMFLVDFDQGRIVDDAEIKETISGRHPYGEWLASGRLELKDVKPTSDVPGLHEGTLTERLKAFGYTAETMRFMLRPLITTKRDPLGSMGNDAALAVMSAQPRLLYDYFKQLFAQVTNPPIDSIREEVVMSLECMVGPEGNLLETREANCHRLRIKHPIISNTKLQALKDLDLPGWRSRTLDATWPLAEGEAGLKPALERLAREAEQAIDDGCALVILSDRRMDSERVAVPTLLACGAVHHHLLRTVKRTRVGLVIETGEAREVHHHSLLLGYGADAVNPYLAFEALWHDHVEGSQVSRVHGDRIVPRYKVGVKKGLLKVMAKMGISTLQSYKGAQIFEAIGLGPEVIDLCFAGTPSRLGGVGFEVLAREAMERHRVGYPDHTPEDASVLPNPGIFHWRARGERHMWTPESISSLQATARSNSRESYAQFARHTNEIATTSCALRGLLIPRSDTPSIALDEVEPASEIVKRFCTGAMSYGSISAESHEALALAMNRLGGKSNTGEGGEDPARFEPLPNGDSKRSAIKQVASGRFGVTALYLTNADELQIKMAQGAKPGEGGELPGHKVDEIIARTRHSTPGVGLISPPPHHDIYSIEDLKQLIHDLKNANPAARVSVKLVSEIGVGTIAAGVAKAHADHILISGHDGGTGASPLTSIKHAGLPWELGLAETHQTLVLNGLRSRVVLQTDGQIKTGRDVAIAAMLGAEEFGFSTAPLIALGCIMMRKCHLNTCPVGIATQDAELRAKFSGKPEHVVNYLFLVAEELRGIMASLGVATVNELIGRTDLLDANDAVRHWKNEGLDLGPILQPAVRKHEDDPVYCTEVQDHGLDLALDNRLIELAEPALASATPVKITLPIDNLNRTVGTTLSHELVKRHGADGLEDDTIHFHFQGSAGQSFGAFLAQGVTLELEGDANDYVGKGLSGGRMVVYPPQEARFVPEDNIIVGNVVLYGATSGEAFFRGRAAERFCVRNSGAHCVVEGVGDHGCEYMTGGRAVVLGDTGRNFAAGMSGGIAWVLDHSKTFESMCNLEMVEIEPVGDEYHDELRLLVERHHELTGSTVAREVLADWEASLEHFRQVMPIDYKRVLLGGSEPTDSASNTPTTDSDAEAAA